MLRTNLIHPQLLGVLAAAGHGATILLADGHYPASTAVGPNATTVHLNLTPGVLDVPTVLEPILELVPLEAATVMVPPQGAAEPAAIGEYRARLGDLDFRTLDRFAFYRAALEPSLALAVVTADVRTYANLLLTVGVRQVP